MFLSSVSMWVHIRTSQEMYKTKLHMPCCSFVFFFPSSLSSKWLQPWLLINSYKFFKGVETCSLFSLLSLFLIKMSKFPQTWTTKVQLGYQSQNCCVENSFVALDFSIVTCWASKTKGWYPWISIATSKLWSLEYICSAYILAVGQDEIIVHIFFFTFLFPRWGSWSVWPE